MPPWNGTTLRGTNRAEHPSLDTDRSRLRLLWMSEQRGDVGVPCDLLWVLGLAGLPTRPSALRCLANVSSSLKV